MTNNDFYKIIEYYRIKKQNSTFIGLWDPFKIRNKRDFIYAIKHNHINLSEDYFTLSLIAKTLNVDIIVLDHQFNIINIGNTQSKIIILFYDNQNKTYKSVGLLTNKKYITLFDRITLPNEIDHFIDKHSLFLHHIKDICLNKMNCSSLELNKIINEIQNRIQTPISKQDTTLLLKLITNVLENENFFKKKLTTKFCRPTTLCRPAKFCRPTTLRITTTLCRPATF